MDYEYPLKQAREATVQRDKVNGIVQAHDVLYQVGVQFYEAKALAMEGRGRDA